MSRDLYYLHYINISDIVLLICYVSQNFLLYNRNVDKLFTSLSNSCKCKNVEENKTYQQKNQYHV